MDEINRVAITVAITTVVVGVMVAVIGSAISRDTWQARAVEHGCASYDPQTGKWGWKP